MVPADPKLDAPSFSRLPFISGLEGIGGTIKAQPAHFRVIEVAEERKDRIPVEEATFHRYRPDGKHVYVTLTREGMTTPDVVSALARNFAVPVDTIGFAGLKDKHAICTQTFSLPRDLLPSELRAADALGSIGERCVAAGFVLEEQPSWHQSKLCTGQLQGNRFEIVLSETNCTPCDALAKALRIADILKLKGWANYFGPQRFGSSLARSRKVLVGRISGLRSRRPHAKWLDTLHQNTLQSALFNECLARRINAGKFCTLCEGDLVRSSDHDFSRPWLVKSAGPDNSTDGVAASESTGLCDDGMTSFTEGKISFTGPLFGAGMGRPRGFAADLEESVWQEYMPGVSLSAIKPSVLSGCRRVGRLPLPSDFHACEYSQANGLIFRFTLPRGTYATSLMREFVGRDIESREGMEDEQSVTKEGTDASDEGYRLPKEVARPVLAEPALWTKAGAIGLRITCESSLHQKEAIAQCMALARKFQNQDVNYAYSVVRTGVAGLLLLRSASDDPRGPVGVALRAFEEAMTTGESPAPLVVQLLPLQSCCAANIDSILETLAHIIQPLGTAEDQEDSYVVRIKQRGSIRIDGNSLIEAVCRLVQSISPHARADLDCAHTAITIDIFDGTACLACLPKWHQMCGYNLRKVAAASKQLEKHSSTVKVDDCFPTAERADS